MLCLSTLALGLALATIGEAQISLGTGSNYGVFAATTITNTGLTVVGGELGLTPGTSITGFPPGISKGEDIDDAAATTAKTDLQNAYNALVALPVTTDLTGQDLGGMTLDSGVYGFSSSGGLTGTLTLDGQNNANALFVFKFGSTLTTASASSVVLINGAQACNVYYQVGSSATLGTTTALVGNVLALTSITATTGVTVNGGGLYALNAAVTLDTNTINPSGSCGGAIATSLSSTLSSAAATATTLSTVTAAASVTAVPTTDASVVTVTSTTTSTLTDPASTTTVTATVDSTVTVTATVATTSTTCTSTKTNYSTKPATKCPATASAKLDKRGKKTTTKTKTVTSTCAGHTTTKQNGGGQHTTTHKITHTSTSTKWATKTATTTSPCTTAKAAEKRDYQRMFE